MILGDDQFASEHRNKSTDRALSDAVKLQQPKHATLSLGEFQARYAERDEAMARAFWSTAFPMTAIARHFGVSTKTVSRAVCRYEAALTAESSA
ncbi:hypothetical protein LP419_21280 [Massilia sp. H-1]|nr:hypothetical protein LP419_21280 [Massilia sp. H-1]